MLGLDTALYIFICGAMSMMAVLGFESAIVTPSLDRWGKRFFITLFTILMLNGATFFFELASYLYPSLTVLQRITYFFQTLLCVIPFPMLSVYLLHCCGEDLRGSLLIRLMAALFAVFFALLLFAQFTNFFFFITPDNLLNRGPAYSLLLVPVLAMLLLVAVGVVRRRDKLPRQYYRAFLICLLPVTFALFVHAFVSAFLLINACLVISTFSMYRIVETSSIERDLRHQREIANQRASIAVLQMRPHFIYNTMTTIYYLCDQDSELAKQVTMDFTAYLRKNLAAIASEDVIPFSEELEHTRAYLAVEQAQFEDELLVDYDTPHVQFSVPPLTLQPIVENAVKHGMDLDSGPLHICVRSRETESGSEITVEDDGPGFDFAVADKPHTTLANIQQRLEMMCGGQLAIAPRKGGGTVVKVTVPQGE